MEKIIPSERNYYVIKKINTFVLKFVLKCAIFDLITQKI